MKYIYLDSFVITKIASGESHLLDDMKKIGQFKIVSSISHIVEALPKSENFVEDSTQRMRTIMDRDTSVLVRPFFEITKIEVENGAKTTIENLICSPELFLPTTEENNWKPNIKQRVKEALNAHLTTEQDINRRRKIRAQFIKHGNIRPSALVPLIDEQRHRMIASAKANFPEILPLFQDGGIYDLILGNISIRQFNAKQRAILLHPVVLAKITTVDDEDLKNLGKQISEFFWNECNKFQSVFEKFINIATNMQEERGVEFQLIEKEWIENYNSLDYLEKIAEGFCGNGPISNLSDLHGTRNFAMIVGHVFLNKLRAHANISRKGEQTGAPKLKRSDYGDFTHTFYQPYVDIFVCDRRTAASLKIFGVKKNNICATEDEIMNRMKLIS